MDAHADLCACILEMMHLLCESPKLNPNLMYVLLQQPDLFSDISEIPRMQVLVTHLNYILDPLMKKLLNHSHASVEQVLETIATTNTNAIPPLSKLSFSLNEKKGACVPYVWNIIFQSSGIYWEAGVELLDTAIIE